MTGGRDHSGDAVRQRLAEIYDGRGENDPLTDYALYDAALTAVVDRHRLEPLYEPCGHSNGPIGTVAEHAWETVQGEWVCGPPVAAVCSTCRDEDGSRIDYPCDEVRAVATALEEPS